MFQKFAFYKKQQQQDLKKKSPWPRVVHSLIVKGQFDLEYLPHAVS